MGKNTARKRKRRFQGNRYTNKQTNENQNEQQPTSSSRAKKLEENLNNSASVMDKLDEEDYFLFVNFKILKRTFQGLLSCPECSKSTICFTNNQEAKMGFANHLNLSCESCGWETSFYTSSQCIKQNTRQKHV